MVGQQEDQTQNQKNDHSKDWKNVQAEKQSWYPNGNEQWAMSRQAVGNEIQDKEGVSWDSKNSG